MVLLWPKANTNLTRWSKLLKWWLIKIYLKKTFVVMVIENTCGCKKNTNTNIRTKFQIVNAKHMEVVSAKYDIGVNEVIKNGA